MKGRGGLCLAFCFVFVFVSLATANAQCNSRCCEEEYPKLVVMGSAEIEAPADKAYFNIRVRVEEKRLEQAFDVSTKKINSIHTALNANGVKKEDIRNLGYTYHPLYEGKKIFTTIDRPTSYEVIHTLKITVYNLDKLGKILADLSEILETSVYGLAYDSTKIEELKRQALKEAAADAKEKALNLAEGAGALLGKVIKIESVVQEPYPRRELMAKAEVAYAMRPGEEKAIPQVEPGYIEIKGTCTVYYSIQ